MVKGTSSAGPEHEAFTEWAKSQEIEINGVAPTRFPGQGVGMAAQRNINANEVILTVPIKAMLTIEHIPSAFRKKFPEDIATQALYAAYFCFAQETREKFSLWQTVWPSRQDFDDSIPLIWPKHLKGESSSDSDLALCCPPLPPAISGRWNTFDKKAIPYAYTADHQDLLKEQESRFEKAYRDVKKVFADVDKELFTYYWLIVHTRSFHHIPPGGSAPDDRNDAMALCPFGDYFNHSAEGGCNVAFDDKEYTFTTTKSYEKGEEIFFSYGNHSSDTLLVDYGFLPAQNQWDALFLDDIILKDLTTENIEDLNFERYLGNYQITASGPCFRTEVAACMKYMTPEDWNRHILGDQPASFDQEKTNAIIAAWIGEYVHEAEVALEKLTALQGNRKYRGEKRLGMIVMRWRQVVELCGEAVRAMDG
ncbi:hypothetical protein FQN55_000122 [Onygenales sp. PD_40]|nr:hypothetical protein FQN55_000122 [Onygenales sp. PD_40]KAK2804584.1 hypothetical protein FQN51_001785 [Onygenales sp. PD_10]